MKQVYRINLILLLLISVMTVKAQVANISVDRATVELSGNVDDILQTSLTISNSGNVSLNYEMLF